MTAETSAAKRKQGLSAVDLPVARWLNAELSRRRVTCHLDLGWAVEPFIGKAPQGKSLINILEANCKATHKDPGEV